MASFFSKIGGRIFLTFSSLLLLLTILYGGLASHYGKQLILENGASEMRVLAAVLSQLIQRQFSSLQSTLEEVADDELVVSSLEYQLVDKLELVPLLQTALKKSPIFDDLIVFDHRGRCVASTDDAWYGIRGKGSAFFEEGLREFNFPPIYGSDSAGKVQLASAPIYDADDRVIGVLVASLRLNEVYELMDEKIGLSENKDAFLLDEDLRFITPGRIGPQELVESHLASTALKSHVYDETWVGEYLNYQGVKVMGTALKIPGYSWYVVVERKYDIIVSRVRDIQHTILISALGLLLLFFVASFLVSRSITKPLNHLIESTRQIALGHLDRPVMTLNGIEELEFLAAEFEKMRSRVAMSQESLRERLQMSEAMRIESDRLAAIGVMASGLAHEIRNPLNAMSLLLSRLKFQVNADVKDKVIEDLFGEISRLDRLVKSILDYAKPLELLREVIDIRVVLKDTVNLFEEILIKEDISWELHVPEEPLLVEGDQDRLKQCFVNLIKNAIEASHKDEARIRIECKYGGDSIRIEVTDHGLGISSNERTKLFSPFFTTKPTGTGLGLSEVKKIILAHGGRVEVMEDELVQQGAGSKVTTFRIELPAAFGC
jgi:signal transduction histidine kinase